MLKRGRNRRAARLRRRAPRASTKARTTGGRLRRMGPRGPLRGRSPLRGLRPPQAARPRPADPPASGARTPLRGTRKTTNLMPRAENNVSSSVHAQQSGFCGPRKHDNPRNACLRLPTQRKPSALRHRGRLLAFLWDGSGLEFLLVGEKRSFGWGEVEEVRNASSFGGGERGPLVSRLGQIRGALEGGDLFVGKLEEEAALARGESAAVLEDEAEEEVRPAFRHVDDIAHP